MPKVPSQPSFDELKATVEQLQAAVNMLETTAADTGADAKATRVRVGALELLYGQLQPRIDELTANLSELERKLDDHVNDAPRIPEYPVWPSHSIVETFGVNTKFRYAGSWYDGNVEAVINLLQRLGVSHIRERYTPRSALQREAFDALAVAGIKLHTTLGVFDGTGPGNAFDELAAGVRANPERWVSVGGPNEPNDMPRPADWAERTLAHQKAIWDRLNDVVTVVGPALKDNEPTMPADYAELTELGIGQYMHLGDFHRYPRGDVPTNGLAERQAMAERMAGEKDTVCTEGGYNTSGDNVVGGGIPVTEEEQGVYAPRHLLEMYNHGVVRFTLYELLDQNTAGNEYVHHWGLVAVDAHDPSTWREKKAFTELAALTALLADPGPEFEPNPVRIKVTKPDEVKALCFVKRNDEANLVLWRDIPADDTSSVPVTVEFEDGVMRTIEVGNEWEFMRVRQGW